MRKLILIAGSGRNVGKTTLACRFIEMLSKEHSVTAVKVSKHHHAITDKQLICYQKQDLLITEETERESSKDSSRYLQAGAEHSFFVQLNDIGYKQLADWLMSNLTGTIICETGYLGNFISPDHAFYIKGSEITKTNSWDFPYITITFDGENFMPSVSELL